MENLAFAIWMVGFAAVCEINDMREGGKHGFVKLIIWVFVGWLLYEGKNF